MIFNIFLLILSLVTLYISIRLITIAFSEFKKAKTKIDKRENFQVLLIILAIFISSFLWAGHVIDKLLGGL